MKYFQSTLLQQAVWQTGQTGSSYRKLTVQDFDPQNSQDRLYLEFTVQYLQFTADTPNTTLHNANIGGDSS